MEKYVCLKCGYVYDPAKGDAKGGVAPGTDFSTVDDKWACPKCGAPSSSFARQG